MPRATVLLPCSQEGIRVHTYSDHCSNMYISTGIVCTVFTPSQPRVSSPSCSSIGSRRTAVLAVSLSSHHSFTLNSQMADASDVCKFWLCPFSCLWPPTHTCSHADTHGELLGEGGAWTSMPAKGGRHWGASSEVQPTFHTLTIFPLDEELGVRQNVSDDSLVPTPFSMPGPHLLANDKLATLNSARQKCMLVAVS